MSSDSQSPSDRPDPNEANPALRARVPDHVADGCFSTGAIVMTGPSEYIVDFLQTIGRPHRVAARVVIPHPVMPQFIEALNTNLQLYRNRFGDPPAPPAQNPNQARRPTPQEIYDDLKLPDEVLSGVYANGVMIGHGASEFGLDFLTSFFPQSAVSARVFVASGQVPRLLESLRGAVRQLEQRRQMGEAQLPPPAATEAQSSDEQSPANPSPESQANPDERAQDVTPGEQSPEEQTPEGQSPEDQRPDDQPPADGSADSPPDAGQ